MKLQHVRVRLSYPKLVSNTLAQNPFRSPGAPAARGEWIVCLTELFNLETQASQDTPTCPKECLHPSSLSSLLLEVPSSLVLLCLILR